MFWTRISVVKDNILWSLGKDIFVIKDHIFLESGIDIFVMENHISLELGTNYKREHISELGYIIRMFY